MGRFTNGSIIRPRFIRSTPAAPRSTSLRRSTFSTNATSPLSTPCDRENDPSEFAFGSCRHGMIFWIRCAMFRYDVCADRFVGGPYS